MAKESKQDVESISARVTKHASKKVAKAEVNLNCSLWIDYNKWLWIVLSVYLKSTEDLAYFISIFSLFHDLFYFLQHLLYKYEEHET